MAGYSVLPDDILSARESGYPKRHYVIPPRLTQRRRFWLEFSVLPHYPSRRTLKLQRKLEKKHRGKDKASNDYDLHDVPAVRFPQFGRLPPEIRLVIWEYALCHPRIVVVTSKYEDYMPVSTTLDPLAPPTPQQQQPWTPPPAELPALMVACRESHERAIKFYERAFDWRVPHVLVDEDDGDDTAVPTRGYYAGRATQTVQGQPRSTPRQRPVAKRQRPSGPGCWFNFAYDSVFLKGELEPCLEAASTSMVYFMSQRDTTRVRYVACSADDLGVGELMANQLYARLFPIIDRFEIKKCLNVVSPPRVHTHRRPKLASRKAQEKARAATEALTTAANIVVTQRNPSGIGYDDQGHHRLNDTQASCMAINAADITQYAGDLNGLESYDMSNNVCQQVWDQWTNSRNMPLLNTDAHHRAQSASGGGSYASGSDSDSDSDSASEAANDELEDADADADVDTQGMDMDVDVDVSPDATVAGWSPHGWTAPPAPSEADGDGQNAQDRDGAPPQEGMRIVMVTEDMLHGTIATIEKLRLYGSNRGKTV